MVHDVKKDTVVKNRDTNVKGDYFKVCFHVLYLGMEEYPTYRILKVN